MFGLHVWPDADKGVLASRPGPFFGASLAFRVMVAGRGGHGAMPHLTADPVVAAAHIITAVQVQAVNFCLIQNNRLVAG